MEQQLKAHLTSSETWKRGLFMLLFALFYGIAEVVLVAVALFQFGSKLFTGHVNRRLLNLGQSLASYIYQIVLFVTFKSDDKPYPFEVWPKGAPGAAKGARSAPPAPAESEPPPTEHGV